MSTTRSLRRTTWQTTLATANGLALLEATSDRQLEGVVAKQLTSRYQPGRRSRDWVKVKHWQITTLPVAGWRPATTRTSPALLLAALASNGTLRPAGTVEWGLAPLWTAGLADALAALATSDCPLTPPVQLRRVVWVRPHLHITVRHLGWTADGHLRQPLATATARVAA